MEQTASEKLREVALGIPANIAASIVLLIVTGICVDAQWSGGKERGPLEAWPEWLLGLGVAAALWLLTSWVWRGRKAGTLSFSTIEVGTSVPNFQGRKQVLCEIRKSFKAQKLVVLRGEPGMGKTSTAMEFATPRWARKYSAVGWIVADTPGNLISQLVRLGQSWEIVRLDEENDREFAQRALNRIGDGGGEYLLIYDNVDTLDAVALLGDLHHPKNIDILITSLFDNWNDRAVEIVLESLPLEDAVRLLETRSNRQDDPKGAAALVKALGFLPLAIEHAAPVCAETGFAQYQAKLSKQILRLPEGMRYPRSVAATFDLGIDRAMARSPDALRMILFLSYCAPDDIPMSLVEGALGAETTDPSFEDRLIDARLALKQVSLIRATVAQDDARPGERAISVHRLVQLAARRRGEEIDSGKAASEALHAVLVKLAALFTPELMQKDLPAAARLIPHVTHALSLIQDRDFDEHEEKKSLDKLARLTVFALLHANENRAAGAKVVLPEYLVKVVGHFYEVEPLSGALDMILREFREQWPILQAQLLETNNYVVRTAMARALGKACVEAAYPALELSGLVKLLEAPGRLNEFELGGYALHYVYSNRPDLIRPETLNALAKHPCYPGRSILGDLSINLALQGVDPRAKFASPRFWDPIWEHVGLDVEIVEAARIEFGNAPHIRGQDRRIDAALDYLHCLKQLQKAASGEPGLSESLAGLIERYFTLGKSPGDIWGRRREIAKAPNLALIMRLLLGHPLWSVQESAASVLSWLIEEGHADASILTGLFDDEAWRVRFGTIEAAYQLRDVDAQLFDDAVDRFYNADVCRLRSLCAENLIATILNLRPRERQKMIRDFEGPLRYWLQDDDCFVLEHIYRLFKVLGGNDPALAALLAGVEPKLMGQSGWWALDRYRFLSDIDVRKQGLRDEERRGTW